MSDRYYDTPRLDALRHLTIAPRRVLEIGCGAGATLRELRARHALDHAVGVEMDATAAQAARAHFDVVIEAPVAQADIESHVAPGSCDLLLCLHVMRRRGAEGAVVRLVAGLRADETRLGRCAARSPPRA